MKIVLEDIYGSDLTTSFIEDLRKFAMRSEFKAYRQLLMYNTCDFIVVDPKIKEFLKGVILINKRTLEMCDIWFYENKKYGISPMHTIIDGQIQKRKIEHKGLLDNGSSEVDLVPEVVDIKLEHIHGSPLNPYFVKDLRDITIKGLAKSTFKHCCNFIVADHQMDEFRRDVVIMHERIYKMCDIWFYENKKYGISPMHTIIDGKLQEKINAFEGLKDGTN